MDKLVDIVTRAIMQKLNGEAAPRVVAFGPLPQSLLEAGCQVRQGETAADIKDCDYVVMTVEQYQALHGTKALSDNAGYPAKNAADQACTGLMVDLTGKRLIHERDLRDCNAKRGTLVRVDSKAIITALAHDYAKGNGIKFCKE